MAALSQISLVPGPGPTYLYTLLGGNIGKSGDKFKREMIEDNKFKREMIKDNGKDDNETMIRAILQFVSFIQSTQVKKTSRFSFSCGSRLKRISSSMVSQKE